MPIRTMVFQFYKVLDFVLSRDVTTLFNEPLPKLDTGNILKLTQIVYILFVGGHMCLHLSHFKNEFYHN